MYKHQTQCKYVLFEIIEVFTLVWEVSFTVKRRDRREKEACGDRNLWLRAMRISLSCYNRCQLYITRSINKQPITTHLSVNNSKSEHTVRFLESGGRFRFWPIGAARSINCHRQPEVFWPLLSSPFRLLQLHGSSLNNLWHPGYCMMWNIFVFVLFCFVLFSEPGVLQSTKIDVSLRSIYFL